MSSALEMNSAVKNKAAVLLEEQNNDREVFQDMDKFEMTDAQRFALSIRIQFPKFSKGFNVADFETFLTNNVGMANVVSIGRLSFPNEWQMQLKTPEAREKLIRLGRTKINTRSCWISPLSHNEIRGFVHWIPNAVGNDNIAEVLRPFGEILFIETQQLQKWTKVDCDTRYFCMKLKNGKTMDDIPHFTTIHQHKGLVTIKGRRPICFHCRELGHRKSECKKYREKLSDYCNRKPKPNTPRIKPRGQRYKPSLADPATQNMKNKRRKQKKRSQDPSKGESQKVEDVNQAKSAENISMPQDDEPKHAAGKGNLKQQTQNACTAPSIPNKVELVQTLEQLKSIINNMDAIKLEPAASQPEKEPANEEKKKKRKNKKKKNASGAAQNQNP